MNKLKHWPLEWHQFLPVMVLLIFAVIAFIFENELINQWVYKRDFIAQGELWRLFSCHLFHTNLNHLLLNLGGLILLWSLHGQYYNVKNYTLLLLVSGGIVSSAIYFYSPQLSQYVGLSGVLHGVFIWGALKDISNKVMSGYLLAIGVILKVIHEQIYGADESVAKLIDATVAIDAHLWGVISGILFFVMGMIIKVFSNKKKA